MKTDLATDMIGVMTDQQPGFLIGMLAALKSGCAFVPIDPEYPDDRIDFILKECEVDILLTEQKHLSKAVRIAEDNPFLEHVICLDSVGSEVLSSSVEVHDQKDYWREAPTLPEVYIEAGQFAYVIYTSGSTGKPKGVPISHRNLCPLLWWSQEYFGFDEHTEVLQNLNHCFDFGIFELLTTLLFGGTLHYLDKKEITSLTEFSEYIEENGINTLHSTPSFIRSIVASGARLEKLEILHLGGEALTDSIIRDIFDQVGESCAIYNGYGPTEATINCSIFNIGNKVTWEPNGLTNIPIGKASANNFIYILDRDGDLAPVGLPGELHVGGTGLAQAYLKRPDLTAEKFIPDPFSGQSGGRLYRTGDLARYLPDGNIEFLGRIDAQVKIRGFRIEPDEIEAVLGKHPGVREAVVVARDEEQSNGSMSLGREQRLVAYVVHRDAEVPTISDLRTFVQEKLPWFMVPSAFVVVDSLPLTPNGKVDRQALPAPDHDRPNLESTFVAPRTSEEEILANIWSDVLGLERVGIHDNFFELGGDSMRIIQVIAQANQAGFRLTPAVLFEHPTVEGLARMVGAAETVETVQDVVTGPVPLTPIQHFFFEAQLTDPHHWNWSFLRQIPEPLDISILKHSIKHLLIHHDALRLRFRETESGWSQFNAGVEEEVPLSVIDLSALGDREQQKAIESSATALQGSLNLSEGPLMRVAYFQLGTNDARKTRGVNLREQGDRVLIIFHHLVVDVISSRILMEDFQTIFEQLSRGEEVRLPAKTSSFQAWSRRLSEYAQSTELRQELSFWVEALKGDAPSLPLDDPSGVNSESSADMVTESLSADETRALLEDIPAVCGAHMNEVLLTALAETFFRWTGKRSLLVELEGHGREYIVEDVDISRTVGWFTTIYPVRIDLKNSVDRAESLESVKELLRRIPNRGIGYGLLRYLCEDIEVRETVKTLPKAQVSFNYLGQLDQKLSESTPFKLAREYKGPERSLRGLRKFPLYIVASVRGGVLRVHWSYSRNLHRRATIERLAEEFMEELRSLKVAIIQKADPGRHGATREERRCEHLN